jgi:hypothetical protein
LTTTDSSNLIGLQHDDRKFATNAIAPDGRLRGC